MQKTRQQILEVLNQMGTATVQEIVDELHQHHGNPITAVTVRHHLNLLQKQNLVTTPEMRHKNKPGRPQHIYTLTESAHEFFPSNYQRITSGLIEQLQRTLHPTQVNVIFEGVADGMATEAQIPQVSLPLRMEMVVDYLNQNGYDASWEETAEGFLLHTCNCPYHEVAQDNDVLCDMDMRLMTSLVGIVPRRQSLVSCGAQSCSYLFPSEK